MEPPRHHKGGGLSYSNLFNLESLMNFQLPHPDSGDYGNSSQDESRSSQGQRIMSNGAGTNRSSVFMRRQKRDHEMRDDDSYSEDDNDYENQITEEHYRSMLGEHVQKCRRGMKFKESPVGSTPTRIVMPTPKRSKGGKHGNGPQVSLKDETVQHEVDTTLEYYDVDVDWEYSRGARHASSLESAYLDIGDDIKYLIPPTYDNLVTTLRLPSYLDIRIEEYILKGTLNMHSLAAMVAADKRFEFRSRGGLAEPQPNFESLQARFRAASYGNSNQKFTLQVSDIVLSSFSIPEGAAGRIRRSIMSESGSLQVCYVKVLEKGDTYEIIERSLPKKQIVKKDPSLIEKEEMEKVGKVWVNIARRDVPKHHRVFTNFHKKHLADAKRYSETCQKEVKLKVSRSLKLMKNAASRTRKLAREMLIFWKRVDKEQAELRKKEEKEAAEALKRQEELREAKRHEHQFQFLLSQTELFSHFMQNKPTSQSSGTLPGDGESQAPGVTPILADTEQDEEDPEEAEFKREAMRAAQHAVFKQKKITNEFDSECLKLRQGVEFTDLANDSSIAGSTNIDLLNPSTMPATSSVQTPEMFKGYLKEYQLKGLQWLVNCYEQGLNGILADEMGLGKTIQAMAFLAHLAEEKNIWGPFLVVAPASVLNNWADEVSRFCPDLKTLPYWGEQSVRQILRKNINPKRLYRRDSGFHILITSYQLLVTDEKILRKVKWQYMVLDEAQAIKSSSSIRWKTLLSFNCRNRLLLTGTPVQNNMAELWALLHFIMPTLFDSHEQFNEWFSKGIESHAEHGGTLNEHQLNRLHAVLKPFMLRRVKKDVISEMTSKTEVTVHCKLSSRQQAFYQAIKNKISLAELFDGRRGHMTDNKLRNLMNIVIQLRKVCNHPELFERNEGRSYFFFSEIPNSLLPPPFGELEEVPYPGGWNPITYKVPKLLHQELIRSSEMPCSVVGHGLKHESFQKLFNIFTPENIYGSVIPQYACCYDSCTSSGAFGFTRLIDLSPAEVSFLANGSILERLLYSVLRFDKQSMDEMLDLFMDLEGKDLETNHLEEGKVRAVARMLLVPTKSESTLLRRRIITGLSDSPSEELVMSHEERFISNIKLLRSTYAFIPPTRAPPINAQCPDRHFAYQMADEMHHPWAKKLFVGFARTSEFNGPRKPNIPHHLVQEIDSELPMNRPLLRLTYRIFGSSPPMQSFDPAKMLTDSGKLQTLDMLLKRLRAENHRVLLFAQMTKMLDILEDYMNYRKYKYFRLDGSSTIVDRRDMVRDFQSRNDIFVFLLSTRAGGLGINLTAADTVIFYESDWNPTLDLQAMDRAHRLGQTKEVTVYRLICKETVEEKILQRASQKNTVQQLVMTGGHVQGDLLKPEDVVSLLLDDPQLEQKLREIPMQAKDRQKKKRVAKGIRVDADGDVAFEEFASPGSGGLEHEPAEQENERILKKRKSSSEGKYQNEDPQRPSMPNDMLMEMDRPSPMEYTEEDYNNIQQRPRRLKRPKKSVNENLEPAFNSAVNAENQQYSYSYRSVGERRQQEDQPSPHSPVT